tara:strand:- start:73 stop:414 length:342 start_codon:yes stop_codon:yes gene_type:complete
VLDDACREIRYKRITRAQGLYLVRKYELNKIKNLNQFCDWIGISNNSLKFVVDRFKNKRFWQQTDIDKWIFNGISKNILKTEKKINNFKVKNFKSNFSNKSLKNDYIYFGKGI